MSDETSSMKPNQEENINAAGPDVENIDELPEMRNISDDAPEETETVEVDVDALVSELRATTTERDEYKDQLLRARAEFENFRKRVARDADQNRRLAAANLIRELLPAADNLDLALQHVADPDDSLAQGVRMVLRQFTEALERAGLTTIPAAGESFDPNIHEAVMQQNSDDVAAGTIITEFQRGYRLGDQVLRPARVVVSSGPAEEAVDTE